MMNKDIFIEQKHKSKIRIAFIMPDMGLGGVEKSLLGLLNAINADDFHVSLLLFRKKGELLSYVPKWVEIYELKGAGKLDAVTKSVSFILSKLGIKRLFFAAKSIYHKYGSRIHHSTCSFDRKYDVVIAYKDGIATWYTAQTNIADCKIAFIHTDFKSAGYDSVTQRKTYEEFDKIYCSSKASRESFLCILPEFTSKTDVLYNALNLAELFDMAKRGIGYNDQFDGLRILTIGRLSHEKGIDKAIEIAARLNMKQYKIRWYIIGDGIDKDLLKRKVASFNVEDDVIFLGKIENPYRYLADCDIYVQPSNYEGYCISLAEARLLGKPIVTCDFCGAREQLIDGVTGIITGMSVDELYAGVEKFVKNEMLRLSFHDHLLQKGNHINSGIDSFCSYLQGCIKSS